MAPIILYGHGYRLTVNPEYGANLTGLTWQKASGSEIALLRTCDDHALKSGVAPPVGCFPMAPFANRIDGGTFWYAGRFHTLPLNRPEENVAIHGLSRFEPFEVTTRTASSLGLLHRCRGDTFAYDLLQELAIGSAGVVIRLTVINQGSTMPFGIGLHPYFVQETGARLCFESAARSQSDDRYLPVRFVAAQTGPDFTAGASLEGLGGFDAHFAGWMPRRTILKRPVPGIAVTMTGQDAFRNLHVFIPASGGLVCIEPVSHVPDVHNRTALAGFGDLTVLEPGESLSGSMLISVSTLIAENVSPPVSTQ